MMDWIKEWIVGLTSVSVLLAAAKTLIPKGSVRQIGEFACGLLLLITMASPLMELDAEALGAALTEHHIAQTQSTGLLAIENTELIKEIIQEKTCAYISDKAEELGLKCTAEVEYEYSEDGRAFPVSVTVKGDWTEEQRRKLERLIESDLAVPKDNQTYERESEP